MFFNYDYHDFLNTILVWLLMQLIRGGKKKKKNCLCKHVCLHLEEPGPGEGKRVYDVREHLDSV